MPRLFVALPVPEEIADELLALQSGVPDARWIAPENFHVTLCFAGEVQGAMMRDFEEELSDIASPRFAVALAGVEQFSQRQAAARPGRHGRTKRPAAVAAAEGVDRGAQLRHRGRTPQVPPARDAGALRQRRGDRPSPGAVHGEPFDLPGRPVDRRAFRALFEPRRPQRVGSIPKKRATVCRSRFVIVPACRAGPTAYATTLRRTVKRAGERRQLER